MLSVNEYFDGNVKSISLKTTTLPATVGVMAAGTYCFNTDCKEVMSVISGTLNVQLEQDGEWQTFIDGQTFEVEANTRFNVKADTDTAYLCKYWR